MHAPTEALEGPLIFQGFRGYPPTDVRARFTAFIGEALAVERMKIALAVSDQLPKRAFHTFKPIWMMVTVHALKGLHSHSEITGGDPHIRSGLHVPRR